MTTSDVIQIVLMGLLVVVTGIYVWRTFAISNATKKQADASVRMAEEMREQRVMASRPVIILKAVHEKDIFKDSTSDYFSHFEIYNTGSGPAIEVEISLLNKEKTYRFFKEKTPISFYRDSFLRAGDPPIKFSPSALTSPEKPAFYLVCEYRSILSRVPQPTWYQTWLPFKTIESSKQGKIYVEAGELKFEEVTEQDRIDAFRSREKPK